jgi:N-carbamoyl-L-amino-acid hydrolase
VSPLSGSVDGEAVVEALRELHELTADDDGAQRVAWTPVWTEAREWFKGRLLACGAEVHRDPAGNVWATVEGRRPEALLLGGHLDSVPGGGWLDGCLNLLAAAEVLRALADEGPPPFTVRVVDWADEEGARFGYGLMGSSAAAGTVDLEALRGLRDGDGVLLGDALRECGVELDRLPEAGSELEAARAYLELHIEQGPLLETFGLPLGAVLGTCGVERHLVRFRGQAAHAGSTPMPLRRDAFLAAARFAQAVRDRAGEMPGAVATTGACRLEPGISTAVAGVCEISVDQRHLDAGELATMVQEASAASEEIAAEERVEVEWEDLWRIRPIRFDPQMVEIVESSIAAETGLRVPQMPSGPLHDAAEVSRAGIPTAMLFVQSLGGISHAKEEDTLPEHLVLAVRVFAAAVERAMERLSGGEEGEAGE